MKMMLELSKKKNKHHWTDALKAKSAMVMIFARFAPANNGIDLDLTNESPDMS